MDSVLLLEGYEFWNESDVADYFADLGLADYREMIIHHRITGKVAPQLTDADLKDMGIKIVGDRCRFRQHIQTLGRRARQVQREKVVWEGKERVFWGCFDECVGTCCGCFPEDPSTYKLTNNHIKVKTVKPARIGPIRLCCCNEYSINNIDLSGVEDVDITGIPPPAMQQVFCCAVGKDVIDMKTAEGEILLTIGRGEGDPVADLIKSQIEECQVMERS
jgi:hypothetical protein